MFLFPALSFQKTTEEDAFMQELIRVESLCKSYPVGSTLWGRATWSQVVEDVSFIVRTGETLGVVGESGSGKSTIGRCLLKLTDPTSGRIFFDGEEITALDNKAMRPFRRRMQIVFQDPFSSLNPRQTVDAMFREIFTVHATASGTEATDKIEELLKTVGLDPSQRFCFPHEFSGGQRQRIGIARALSVRPQFIVCDEPVSALDVSVQAQIIELLMTLQETRNLSYLFIGHDLAVVRHIADRIAVLYRGQMMEMGPSDVLFDQPLHPYTQALIASVPEPDPSKPVKPVAVKGDIADSSRPSKGCLFQARCPWVEAVCRDETPRWRSCGQERFVRCHKVTGDNPH